MRLVVARSRLAFVAEPGLMTLLLMLSVTASGVLLAQNGNRARITDRGNDATDSLGDYFPLMMENEWVYYYGNTPADTVTLSVFVLDTASFSGIRYFCYGSEPGNPTYFRSDSSGRVFKYWEAYGLETLWFNFNIAEGDTYQTPFFPESGYQYVVTTRSRSEVVEGRAGTFDSCIYLTFDVPTIADEEEDYWFAPNVGIVQRVGAWRPWQRLYSAKVNGRIYPDVTTNVQVGDSGDYPIQYLLYSNYPNPFNPSTTIRYELPTQSHVVLKIFNLLGQEVAVLVDEEKEAGRYEARWHAAGFATGMYFYRLKTGEFMNTKNLILLR